MMFIFNRRQTFCLLFIIFENYVTVTHTLHKCEQQARKRIVMHKNVHRSRGTESRSLDLKLKKPHWIRSKTRIQLLELVTATQSSLTWTSITFSIQCQACGSNLNRTNCARQMYIKKWTHSKCHNEL